MKVYEATREIINPCANIYHFDPYFPKEIITDNLENYIAKYLNMKLPQFSKYQYKDGTIIYILDLPRTERYTFTPL